ncbi:MAG: dihydroorotase [Pseudomonadota bacterium]
MSDTLTITRPDDWHLHVRDGAMLHTVVPFTARQFGRALIMPNLTPPVTTSTMAMAYRERILQAVPKTHSFNPVMSLYLTDNTSVEEVDAAADNPAVVGFKLYPAGATTNSQSGVTSISNVMSVLERMAEKGVILQIHGEVTDPQIDIFDREAVFIEQILHPLRREIPALRIILEHITTTDAVEYVKDGSVETLAATITPQHLMYSRNAIFQGGIRPHYYCLPILKRSTHQAALQAAATSGDARFFLGTDSAPHRRHDKESECGCAGCFTAMNAIELYAEVFDSLDQLHRLEAFSSFHGADFYGLPRNDSKITLDRVEWVTPDSIPVDGEAHSLQPFDAGVVRRWKQRH